MANDFEAARFLAAVGENVLIHRETAGLSQEDLASQTGLTLSLIDEIERGRVDVRLLTLERIAIALNAEMIDLLDVSGTEIGLRNNR